MRNTFNESISLLKNIQELLDDKSKLKSEKRKMKTYRALMISQII